MTDEQFGKLMDKLEELNQNIKLITAKDTGKETFGLSDIYSEISSLSSSIGDVETAVDRVNTSVQNY